MYEDTINTYFIIRSSRETIITKWFKESILIIVPEDDITDTSTDFSEIVFNREFIGT
ncbi:MAG: hypothetical protein H6546_07060 [Chitinophagales bacterium]|nr:hypothetical protein [Chitinophagales bacterium]